MAGATESRLAPVVERSSEGDQIGTLQGGYGNPIMGPSYAKMDFFEKVNILFFKEK